MKAADVFCIYKNSSLFTFQIFTSATTSSSVLLSQLSKISEPVLLKKIQRWIYVIYLSSINLIYFSFNNYYIFLKCILWQNEVFELRVCDLGNTIHFSFLRTQFFPSSQKITIPKHTKKEKSFFFSRETKLILPLPLEMSCFIRTGLLFLHVL